MTERKKFIKNINSLFLVQVANYVFPLISVPIISRIIGPDKFGLINYSAAFVNYFSLLIGYGFDLTATRKIAQNPTDQLLKNKVFNEVFTAKIFLFTISNIIFFYTINRIPILADNKIVVIYSFIYCIGSVFTQNWLFQAMQDLTKIALMNLVSKFLYSVTVIILIKKESDYLWQPITTSLIQIVIGISSFIWACKRYNLKVQLTNINKVVKILWSEKTIFISLIIISLYTTTNTIILGYFQNEIKVGYYTAGQRIVDIIRSVLSIPLTMALYPYIGKAFSIDKSKGVEIVQRIIPYIIYIMSFITIIIYFGGPWIIETFYGKGFSGSTIVLKILSLIPLIITLSNMFGIQIMLNLKMDKVFLKTSILGAFISLLLNYILVKNYGYIGTAISWTITELFITITTYITLVRNGINPINKKYFNKNFMYNNIRLGVND